MVAPKFTNAAGNYETGIQVYDEDTGTWYARTLTEPAAGVEITNANGLVGNPTFALADDLAALEGLAGTGIAVRSAADTWVQRSITGSGGATITNDDGVSGNINIDAAGNGGDKKWENLGIYYSGGTLTIKGADGNDLSASNPGYVYIPHSSDHGETVVIELTSNFSFNDAAHASSDIIGNTFGSTAGVAWDEDCPFFVHLIINDDADTIKPCLMRSGWWETISVTGKPSDPSCDSTIQAWCFDDVTFADYTGNPGICIGSFRMRKSASDDWTVQALTAKDGVGRYNESTLFIMPQGQNGAVANSFVLSNAGTEPQFTTEEYFYHIKMNGLIEMICYNSNLSNTPAGSQLCGWCLPMISRYSNHQAVGINCTYYYNGGSVYYDCGVSGGGVNNGLYAFTPSAGTIFVNASFATNDLIFFGGVYEAY